MGRRLRRPACSIYSYENYDAIAANKDIDAVYIALPTVCMPSIQIRAVKAGKHVLCEKPMANTAAEAQAMVNACRTAGKKLMIGWRRPFCKIENQKPRAKKGYTI